ncbi:MAG: hypothetical protein J5532_07625 [Lachnospiraceae bacterium]|nr:hypothetical protein [Lachnospiraceae bacterium]
MKAKKLFRRLRIAGTVIVILAMVYLGVHFVCCEAVMGPFLNGEKTDGWFGWYVEKDTEFEVSARRFGLMKFYGEVHVVRTGGRRIELGGEEPKPTCGLIVWRGVGFVDYGLMITVPQEKGIHAYLIKITEEGEYISENILSLEEEAFVKTFLDDNKQEILELIGKYQSIGG